MPAEWHPHSRCWMAWPPPRADDFYSNLPEMRIQYAQIAQAIARFEPVTMLSVEATLDEARTACGPDVSVAPLPLDDAWTRDSGPTYLLNGDGRLGGVDWHFNAWGRLTDRYADDALLAERLLDRSLAQRFTAPVFLEGGAIHTDGEGTVLTTESVILNANRNPGIDRARAERVLGDYLDAEQVIWLRNALEFDDTDGHVDNLACFARPGLVLALTESDPADSNYAGLAENLERLRAATDARGRSLEVIEIQQPRRRDDQGHRLPASYINFYIANGGIVMPGFDDPMDEPARLALQHAFPDREVIQVAGLEVVKGGGGIHCVTQQQPLSRRDPRSAHVDKV